MSFRELKISPNEGISLIKFNKQSNQLFTITWSGKLHIYDIELFKEIKEFNFGSPLISGCWINSELILCGSIDGKLFLSNGIIVNAHQDAISSIVFLKERNMLVTSSWDMDVKIWDMDDLKEPLNIFNFNQKIMFMGVSGSKIVSYGNMNYVFIVDIDDEKYFERRIASLGKQLRTFEICPDGLKWAIGSIDGRIALEYFGDLKHQAQRFSFNCNKHENDEDKVIIYPINSLAFHPITGILTSCDSFGRLFFWDIENKRKLAEIYATHDNSVSSIDYNSDGSLLAISYSYMFDKGPIQDEPHDLLLIYNPPKQFIIPIHNHNEESH